MTKKKTVKLSTEDLEQLRFFFKHKHWTKKELASWFDISYPTVVRILNGKRRLMDL